MLQRGSRRGASSLSRFFGVGLLLAIGLLVAWPAAAGNGHFLHGVGAVNSSFGGAGAGLPLEVISALHANPALLTQFEDHNVAISVEGFVDDLSVTTEGPGFPRHTTDSDGELGLLPAVGWSYHRPGSRVAVGWGLLAVAGFRTNYPADPDSFLLLPQPVGFGRLQTELQVTKVPFAVAWQATDNLSLGASLNLYQSRLLIQPLPVVVPDCNDPNNPSQPGLPDLTGTNCFRPSNSALVSEFAFSLQAGLFWQINSQWSLGLSYTTSQDYDPFTWQSQRANPNLANFGQPRQISIDLDSPAIASFGIGFTPGHNLRFAFDYRWVGYNTENGIGGSGGINSLQQLVSIGWQDIDVFMLGVEWKPGVATWRFGLNFNESPIEDRLTLNSGGTPSVFEEHYTIGVTVPLTPHFDLNLGGYYTPENEKTGPFIDGNNQAIPNTSITIRNSIVSGLIGFQFTF